MIALKLEDETLNNVLEVSLQPNMDDDSKRSVVLMIESPNNEKNEMVSNFYYIDDLEYLNALISKLIECKKGLE